MFCARQNENISLTVNAHYMRCDLDTFNCYFIMAINLKQIILQNVFSLQKEQFYVLFIHKNKINKFYFLTTLF
jgi:hypothetical protein